MCGTYLPVTLPGITVFSPGPENAPSKTMRYQRTHEKVSYLLEFHEKKDLEISIDSSIVLLCWIPILGRL